MTIYGQYARPQKLNLFNIGDSLLANSSLFPYVLIRKLALVGVSLRNTDTPLDIVSGDSWITDYKPGIINLHYINSCSRITVMDQSQTDWYYLHNKKGLSDLLVLLLAVPVLLYHQSTNVAPEELNIFGLRMLNMTMANAVGLLSEKIETAEKSPVFFVNPDCLNKAFDDVHYYNILSNNNIVFPDGIGIALAGKILKTPLLENLNGTDMLPHLCELASSKGYNIFLLGASPGVAEAMKVRLVQKYQYLRICGTRDGFFNWDSEALGVIDTINNLNTHILLVAFGAPLQELFIHKYSNFINAPIQMGVGGLFDFYSDRIPRAPLWMRQIGLEWVFRLLMEPKRMWRRYILGNPLFLFRVFRWKMMKSS
jgi:N-acetylglucosaminyldiphosphoundecaprenol N-acetyl-beta-D-mannosaminyltransferase